MKRSSATWFAVALLLSLALVANSTPDDRPDQAIEAADSTAEAQGYAPGSKHGHYNYDKDEGYDKHNVETYDVETYPAKRKYKNHDKPEHYRGDGHVGDGDHDYKPKHNGHYPKPPKCPFCPKNLTECTGPFGTQCFDLAQGLPFCGACNRVCPDGSSCNNGTCVCDAPLTQCGPDDNFVCADLANDNNFCGNCTNACDATTETCQAGECKPQCPFCPKNLTECTGPFGAQCFDLAQGLPFCGACNRVCPDGSSCNNGTCVCDAPLTQCGPNDNFVCAHLADDINFCGNCTNACNAKTETCQAGKCKPIPPPCQDPAQTQCFPSLNANGSCANLATDPNNCGRCGKECDILTGNKCTDGKCCLDNQASCVADFQCCGFNILSLFPDPLGIPLGTARCQGDKFLTQKCCKDINLGCDNSGECCAGQECKSPAPSLKLPKSCQKIGCKVVGLTAADRCSTDDECCAGLRCSSIRLLGKKCIIKI